MERVNVVGLRNDRTLRRLNITLRHPAILSFVERTSREFNSMPYEQIRECPLLRKATPEFRAATGVKLGQWGAEWGALMPFLTPKMASRV